MTITRLRQAAGGFDSANNIVATAGLEWDAISTSGILYVSNANPKSGTYSYAAVGYCYGQWNPPATKQLRTGGHFCPTPASGPGTLAYLVQFLDASNNVLVGVGFLGNALKLYVGGDLKATAPGIYLQNQYQHVGLDAKIDGSAGWATVYVDGIEVATWSGNTGSADITQVRWVGMIDSIYLDDLFLDDTTGESAAAIVPDRRFFPIYPIGNGTYNEGTGSDADQTDNYLLVDDHNLHDSDTTYVKADSTDLRDTYIMGSSGLTVGWTVAAVIPVATAKKMDADTDVKLAMMITRGSDWEGSDIALGTAYRNVWERRTLAPDNTAWEITDLPLIEAGWRSQGTYA